MPQPIAELFLHPHEIFKSHLERVLLLSSGYAERGDGAGGVPRLGA